MKSNKNQNIPVYFKKSQTMLYKTLPGIKIFLLTKYYICITQKQNLKNMIN
jgi:hypothetical protein